MFTGLCAFPLTPMDEDGVDERAFAALVARLRAARVDAVGALGSTGGYPYLDRAQRARLARRAVEEAGDVPVLVGIGALRTAQVLALAEDAQAAGAAALLLPPLSYQRLTEDEVLGLYEDVTAELSVPLCVYDNPTTTGFTFTDELHGAVAHLPGVAALKIPAVPADPAAARERVDRLRALVPAGVRIGVSGDASAASGLRAGCDLWFSVVGGLFPEAARRVVQDPSAAEHLLPLWELFARHGSLRVVAAAAEHLALTGRPNLPRPLRGLEGRAREEVVEVLRATGLAG